MALLRGLGSVHWITRSGTRGEARTATAEKGEEYLRLCVESSELVFREIERTFAAMPPILQGERIR